MCKEIIFISMHDQINLLYEKYVWTFSLFMKNEKLWRYNILFCKFELMK